MYQQLKTLKNHIPPNKILTLPNPKIEIVKNYYLKLYLFQLKTIIYQ